MWVPRGPASPLRDAAFHALFVQERGRLAARLEALITEKRSLQAETDVRRWSGALTHHTRPCPVTHRPPVCDGRPSLQRANHEMQLALQQSTDRIAQLQASEVRC